MDNLKPSEISEVLLRQLRDVNVDVHYEEVGQVMQVSDGIVRLYGLTNAEAGELLEFDNGLIAVVMNLEEDNVGAVLLGSTDRVKEGMTARRTGRIDSIKVSEKMLGRVIKKERGILLTVLGFAVFYVFFTALVMFNAEPHINPATGEPTFRDFFDALYWATVTLTTVGYGDMVPVTDIGRFVSMLSALLGVAVIALPSGVITARYLEELNLQKKAGKKPETDEKTEE